MGLVSSGIEFMDLYGMVSWRAVTMSVVEGSRVLVTALNVP